MTLHALVHSRAGLTVSERDTLFTLLHTHVEHTGLTLATGDPPVPRIVEDEHPHTAGLHLANGCMWSAEQPTLHMMCALNYMRAVDQCTPEEQVDETYMSVLFASYIPTVVQDIMKRQSTDTVMDEVEDIEFPFTANATKEDS